MTDEGIGGRKLEEMVQGEFRDRKEENKQITEIEGGERRDLIEERCGGDRKQSGN